MQPLHVRAIGLASAVALLTVGSALAGCSSNSGPSSAPTTTGAPASPTSAPAGTEPASGTGAIQAIETNWAKFFNAKTPVPQRIALLQNGQTFAPVIRAQAGSVLARLATAKVTHVTLTGTSQAAVIYSILISGSSKAGLPGLTGVAVYQGGVWKVGKTSFCGLLKLENGGKSKGLFAACKG
jgi:hypothetical protein